MAHEIPGIQQGGGVSLSQGRDCFLCHARQNRSLSRPSQRHGGARTVAVRDPDGNNFLKWLRTT